MNRQMLWLIVAITLLCLGSTHGQRESCDMPPTLTGPCKNYQTRWFFHQDLKECIMFDWGGCQQTKNLFDSLQQCESLCLGIGEVTFT